MESKVLNCNIEAIQEYLADLPTDILLVVVDSNVWQIYRNQINLSFQNKKVIIYTAIPGEDSKTFREFEKCLEFFLSRGIHRQAHLVVIGGGAVSDMAGFVAATLMRGIPWHVIPTSLLAMVDAAIGGKVAINSQLGKNLIGSFHAPEQVILCPTFLKSLPKEEHWSGVGELLKYTLLDSEIDRSVSEKKNIDIDLIMQCAHFKQKITGQDFKENGLRKILNLGHTIGHALEWHYHISHGEAVLWGMLTELAVLNCEEAFKHLKQRARDIAWPKLQSPWYQKKLPLDVLAEIMQKDKKMQNEQMIDLIKAKSPGQLEFVRLNFDRFVEMIREHDASLRTLSI